MTHELELKARRVIEEGFSQGNLDAIDAVVSPTMIEHEAVPPGVPQGSEGLKIGIQMLRAGFSDFKFEIVDVAVIESENKVWLRLIGTGTNDGSMMGQPPTGRSINMEVIEIMRFEDGLLVEHWGVADRLGMTMQLGGGPGGPGGPEGD